MIEHHIDIDTADGAMNTFVVHPDENAPFPVVLFYMDAPGKRNELHDMARRIAADGYFVVLPNLYYRRSRDFALKERTEPEMAEMFAHMATLDAATTRCDTAAMLKFVDAQSRADARRVGAVGYCMSGPFVMRAAAAFPDRLRCIASVYGANMVTDKPDSPHRMARQIRCESYFACAEIDRWAPKAAVETLQKALQEAGTPHRIEWHPGVEHGSRFRCAPASTTSLRPRDTGRGCSACFARRCGPEPGRLMRQRPVQEPAVVAAEIPGRSDKPARSDGASSRTITYECSPSGAGTIRQPAWPVARSISRAYGTHRVD